MRERLNPSDRSTLMQNSGNRTTATRFCLTDGRKWILSAFSEDDMGNRLCYEGNSFLILEPSPGVSEASWKETVHCVVKLVYHWVRECLLSIEFRLIEFLHYSRWLTSEIRLFTHSMRCPES